MIYGELLLKLMIKDCFIENQTKNSWFNRVPAIRRQKQFSLGIKQKYSKFEKYLNQYSIPALSTVYISFVQYTHVPMVHLFLAKLYQAVVPGN